MPRRCSLCDDRLPHHNFECRIWQDERGGDPEANANLEEKNLPAGERLEPAPVSRPEPARHVAAIDPGAQPDYSVTVECFVDPATGRIFRSREELDRFYSMARTSDPSFSTFAPSDLCNCEMCRTSRDNKVRRLRDLLQELVRAVDQDAACGLCSGAANAPDVAYRARAFLETNP